MMKRMIFTFVVALAAASTAGASCREVGTQVHCTLGSSDLVLGTQTADEPAFGGLPVFPLQGGGEPVDRRPAFSPPFRVELQNVGIDPRLCWRFGDETYCH